MTQIIFLIKQIQSLTLTILTFFDTKFYETNQILLIRRFSLFTILVIALILSSCSESQSDNSDNDTNQPDNQPSNTNNYPKLGTQKCQVDPTLADCNTGSAIDQISNRLLIAGAITESVTFLDVSPKQIENFEPKKTTKSIADFQYGAFDKDNIFKKITTSFSNRNRDRIVKVADKYYYNHIDGNQFTSFLPSAYPMAILSLDPKNNALVKLGEIGNSQNEYHINKTPISDSQKKYDKFLDNSKDYTFKGYAFARFANGAFRYNYGQTGGTPNNSSDYALEDKIHIGEFELKIINERTTDTSIDKPYFTRYNNFSFEVTFNEKIEANEGPRERQADGIWKVAHKKLSYSHADTKRLFADKLNAHVTSQFEEFGATIFQQDQESAGRLKIENTESYFGFSYKNEKPYQVAGVFRFFKYFRPTNLVGSNYETQTSTFQNLRIYLDVIFASTKVCEPNTSC